ncbi:MAG TPA: hypothetical protein VH561_01675 [Micromonosporaceae bacterium]|jgi:hypothetical protein
MRRVLVTMVTLTFLLGACSSGPSADDWARSVCDALTPWRAAIDDLNERASEQMASSTTPEQTRQHLVALVTDAREATETARAAVASAGIPDVAGGAQVADGFTTSLSETRDAYAAAADELLALPADDEAAFYDGVVAVLGRLNQRYEQAGTELTKLDSPQLRDAFDRLPECS